MEQALKTLDGVSDAAVNLADHNVTIQFDEATTSINQIKEAIEGAGYEVVD